MPSKPAVSLLLVDDRPDKLLALEATLEPLGYSLRKAESGREALRILLQEKVHLVILDVNMPGLNGFETAKLIRERETLAELPIIFVSAYDSSATETEEAYALGAVDFIHTPLQPAVLRARVSTFVSLRLQTEALEKTNSDLTEVNKQMGAFLYTVSHDLRAPLRTINGFSKILLEEARDKMDPEHAELLGRVALSGLKMNRLLDDLLRYCQLADSAQPLASVNVGDALEDVRKDLQADIQERGADLTVANDFPAVLGNRALISQVLYNLIGNAIKFVAPQQKASIRVWWAPLSEGKVRIIVEDNGIGVAREHQQRIFGVFERLHNEQVYAGTGIGLAIVRRAVERMGGRTGLESELGKGSRFWFELARATASPS